MNALISSMTEKEFGTVFTKLAFQMRWMDADAVAVKSYYEVLRDVPLEVAQASATEIARNGIVDDRTGERRRGYFPTAAQWYEVAQHAAKEQLRKALPAGRGEPWHFDCEGCMDTGWEEFDCKGDSLCGRKKPHGAHAYVRICPCRPTNATYQRHQNFGSGGAD